ncbi:MAG: hypothetical protein OXF28_04185 [Thaumarchaeota archaeon]|nr:hypothetical protein [Nitrososphaerota archaeon]MCY3976311.1 hypothetical protein [Nitrososphaerota archaeon]
MESILEFILNLVGLMVGTTCGIITYNGFNKIGSPSLLRLAIAFFSIGVGFMIMLLKNIDTQIQENEIEQVIQIAGVSFQTVGYFFIAFSHIIKSFFAIKKYFSIVLPIFLITVSNIENIIRSVSFILLIYGSIETILSYLEKKTRRVILIALGLLSLAFGEFLSWYQLIFPESIFYNTAIILKIIGLILLFLPIAKIRFSFNKSLS